MSEKGNGQRSATEEELCLKLEQSVLDAEAPDREDGEEEECVSPVSELECDEAGGESMADVQLASSSSNAQAVLRQQCRRWTAALKNVLDDDAGRRLFHHYLYTQAATGDAAAVREQAAWLFFLACAQLKAETDPSEQQRRARAIFERFVRGPPTSETVSLLHPTETELLRRFHDPDRDVDDVRRVFEAAQRECRSLLEWSCFPAFRQSAFLRNWMLQRGVRPEEILPTGTVAADTSPTSDYVVQGASGRRSQASAPAAGSAPASQLEQGRRRPPRELSGYAITMMGDDGMTPRERLRPDELYRDMRDVPPPRPSVRMPGSAAPPVPPRAPDPQRKAAALQQLESVKQRCLPYLQRHHSQDSHDVLLAHADRTGSPPEGAGNDAQWNASSPAAQRTETSRPGPNQRSAWMASVSAQMQQRSQPCTTDSGLGRSSASEASRVPPTLGQQRPVRREQPVNPRPNYPFVGGTAAAGVPRDEVSVMWKRDMNGEWFSTKYTRPVMGGPNWHREIRFGDIRPLLPVKFLQDPAAKFYCKSCGPRGNEKVWEEMLDLMTPVPLFQGQILLVIM
ncbi:uncharacterized protein LOC129593332 [Paramacrobiotus metropolitanus]|uniref:uncharacterized protein LOC129593332 n=1 Tax=Paramacrobiotus metropolitanus TaxID=2943436 RepID=UPI00244585E4|nr:uncharacterized protein LOC129593332 [Paramacrobiotus metropolitanus]